MSVLVKICGITTPLALEAALEAGADMVGFVYFEPSPRHLNVQAMRALGERVKGRAKKVVLTVDAGDDTISRIIDALEPDLIQLHGKETPERVIQVRTVRGLPVMKALPIATASDLSSVHLYAKVADRILFDARAPKTATRPGGLGKTFDWHILENLVPRVPFILSGGLDSTNIAEALKITRATGVDVSSGVESAPGIKDADKIRTFIRTARQAAADLELKSMSNG